MPLLATDPDLVKSSRQLSLEAQREAAEHRRRSATPKILYLLHIPKCGGTSAAQLWRSAYPRSVMTARLNAPSDLKHCRLHEVEDVFDFSLATVRHPLTWYESWWRYLLSPKVTNRPETLGSDGKPNFDTWIGEGVWHPLREIAVCHDDRFERFIDNVIDHRPGFVSRMYTEYLGETENARTVDYILPMENLYTSFSILCTELGLRAPQEPTHNNRSSTSHLAAWGQHQQKKMQELEQTALSRFGYN